MMLIKICVQILLLLAEAERSKIPLSLWTLDDLVRTLIEYYEHVDIETKLLMPLRKMYLPVLSD